MTEAIRVRKANVISRVGNQATLVFREEMTPLAVFSHGFPIVFDEPFEITSAAASAFDASTSTQYQLEVEKPSKIEGKIVLCYQMGANPLDPKSFTPVSVLQPFTWAVGDSIDVIVNVRLLTS